MPNGRPRHRRRDLLGTFIIASIAYIVLGVFMVAKAQAVADGINIVFGVAMLVFGVISIIAFFLNKDNDENLFMELALGVIAVGLGVFALVAQPLMMKILFYAIGGVLIIDGLVNIKRAVNMKSMGWPGWKFPLIAAAIGIILGILCVILYASLQTAVVVFIGITLIYEGIASLIIIIIDSRIRRRVTREIVQLDDRDID